MSQISFGSTYRIPVTQPGVNNAKKEKLRIFVESYENGIVGKSKTGYARVSVPDSMDEKFVSKLKSIGYKVFQKFEGNNISKENLDAYIKERLDSRNYIQKGKNIKRLSREMREQRRYENSITSSKISSDKVSPKFSETLSENQIDNSKNKIISGFEEESIPTEDALRNSEAYAKIKSHYGEEFAEALFFGNK